ncbi:ankyrin repeat domain-containing protein [Streptomyces sp. NPDC001787]|uniref:ankyrin repeat domain-containing protein n=1 Tax=Streptomyces sp. NPDC001787 TaxID=3154523 RepID=UPI00332F9200
MGEGFAFENPWTPAHQAVEMGDHDELSRLLYDGANPDEICCGMTLLVHAIDLEGDSALQSGNPLSGAATAIILAFGADPFLVAPMGEAPLQIAESYGHDIARLLILEKFGER